SDTHPPRGRSSMSDFRIVLLGKSEDKKTKLGNIITGCESFQHQKQSLKMQCGEVCGRWVSLVELPALYGKPQEAVMEESFKCISLCDPEGVHAFILVLPVAPLTDEDEGELETIQDTFSSRVNDFTMILFTVDSDFTDPAVLSFLKENKDIQELCKSCGGRYFVLNMKDKQKIPELLETAEKMRLRKDKLSCYTKETFGNATIAQVITAQKENKALKAELKSCKYT
uniref:AIG1-type G domain-containing protein n=1 Tax=Haplochromis burtoni TaxID=8153 RepID=A0A3Q2V275_HAPBU